MLLYSSHMYILYSTLLYFSQCHSDIARPNIYIFLNSFLFHLDLCLLLWIVRYYCIVWARNTSISFSHFTPAITSAKYVYVTNQIWLIWDLSRSHSCVVLCAASVDVSDDLVKFAPPSTSGLVSVLLCCLLLLGHLTNFLVLTLNTFTYVLVFSSCYFFHSTFLPQTSYLDMVLQDLHQPKKLSSNTNTIPSIAVAVLIIYIIYCCKHSFRRNR